MEPTTNVLAISVSDYRKWGCPTCGFRSSYSAVSFGGAAVAYCTQCNHTFVLLAAGVSESPIKVDNQTPSISPHPRTGTPSHGKPDVAPASGGEFFRSRGIGLAHYACFVCQDNLDRTKLVSNIAAFVVGRKAGERVVEMFGEAAFLDYRESEPDRVQVKIGACKKHKHNLKRLDSLVQDGIITAEKIAVAKNSSTKLK